MLIFLKMLFLFLEICGFSLHRTQVSRFFVLVKNQVGLNLYSLLILLLQISLFSLFFFFVFLVIKHYKYILSKINNVLQEFPSFIFFLIAVFCDWISLIIDEFLAHQFGCQFLVFLEELFEINISLSFLFFSLGIKYDLIRVTKNNFTAKALWLFYCSNY